MKERNKRKWQQKRREIVSSESHTKHDCLTNWLVCEECCKYGHVWKQLFLLQLVYVCLSKRGNLWMGERMKEIVLCVFASRKLRVHVGWGKINTAWYWWMHLRHFGARWVEQTVSRCLGLMWLWQGEVGFNLLVGCEDWDFPCCSSFFDLSSREIEWTGLKSSVQFKFKIYWHAIESLALYLMSCSPWVFPIFKIGCENVSVLTSTVSVCLASSHTLSGLQQCFSYEKLTAAVWLVASI